jgi:hypothetical protein
MAVSNIILCGHCSVADVMAVYSVILYGHCSVDDVMAVSNIILFGHCSVDDVMAVSNIILCRHCSVADVMQCPTSYSSNQSAIVGTQIIMFLLAWSRYSEAGMQILMLAKN